MAFAIVAGISPVYGLYTAIVSAIAAALFGNAALMTTGPTNALAVVLSSTLAPFAESTDFPACLVTLTFLVGAIQLLMGLLRLGGLMRYVSRAVMTGFITGAAMLILLGQLGNLTGISIIGQHSAIDKIAALMSRLDQLDAHTLSVGLLAIVLILMMQHTRYAAFSSLIAIALSGMLVALLGWDVLGVILVRDLSPVPRWLPSPGWPDLGLADDMTAAALALAVLGLVQTSALAQSIQQSGNELSTASHEFVGQGLANLIGSFFQAMPAGGSLSRTAVNIKAGARTRWSNVWSGLFVALIMLLFSGLVEQIVLAALAGVLVMAAISLINPSEIRFIWQAGWASRLAMTATFVSTFVVPLQYSVYVGVALSLALYVYQSSRIRVARLEPVGINTFREVPLPETLPSGEPVIISVQGNLFFAAMRDLRDRLPKPNGARCPVVILRLRGDEFLAGTGAAVLVAYADQLRAQGGKLVLCGIEDQVVKTLARTDTLDKLGKENIFPASDVLLSSTQDALDYAQAWLDEQENCSARPQL